MALQTNLTPSSNPTIQPIDDYTMARIDFRVHQLRFQFDLSDEDQEDVRNDMVMELLTAFKRFNPTLAKRETFINRVLDRYVLYVMRQRCTQLRHASDTPLSFDEVASEFQPTGNDPRQGQLSEQDLSTLRLDMQSAITRLSKRDQHIARLLMVYSPSEVADRIGVHRCSMSRIIGRIRERFIKAGMEVWNEERNTFAPTADVESEPGNKEVTQ